MRWLVPSLIAGLEALLLWRLASWKAWRVYPAFFWYFLYVFVRLVLLYYLNIFQPLTPREYSLWFWWSGFVAVTFRFAVAWEVFKHLFVGRPNPYRTASSLIVGTMLALAAHFFTEGPRGLHYIVDAELSMAFTIAFWMVVSLCAVRYYGLRPSTNAWGLTTGLSVLCIGDAMNFSAWGLNENAFPIARHIRPMMFLLTLVVWLRFLWRFAPPACASDNGIEVPSEHRDKSVWESVIESIRNALSG